MNTVLHKSETRGHFDHGWLDTRHTFSFARYYDPERMNFGALRVLNDDLIAGGTGFGRHGHDNMEIISVPVTGALEHKDSAGNTEVIGQHEVQVMSAGTGILHEEHNRERGQVTNFLQLWILPRERDVEPRYDQAKFDPVDRKDRFQVMVKPGPSEDGLWIHQDAWLSRGSLSAGLELPYAINRKGNGLYVFMIDGEAEVAGIELGKRDGLGLWNLEEVPFRAKTDAEILLVETPMSF